MNGLAQTNTAEITSVTEDNVTVNVSKNSNSTIVNLKLTDAAGNEIQTINLSNGKASFSLSPSQKDKVYRIEIIIAGDGSSATLTVNVKSNTHKKIYKMSIQVSPDAIPPDQESKNLGFIVERSQTELQTGEV